MALYGVILGTAFSFITVMDPEKAPGLVLARGEHLVTHGGCLIGTEWRSAQIHLWKP